MKNRAPKKLLLMLLSFIVAALGVIFRSADGTVAFPFIILGIVLFIIFVIWAVADRIITNKKGDVK